MRNTKKLACVMLAFIMALSLCGCFRRGGKDPVPNLATQPAATEQTAAQTDKSTPVPTDASATEQPTEVVTEAPTEAPDADAEFLALDLELFRETVVSSADTYNQFVASDPAMFGIDPDEVEKGWGDYYTLESHTAYIDGCREALARLARIDREALSEQNKYAYDAIKRNYETDLLFEDYYYYDEPLTPMNGMHTALPLSMVCFAVRNKADVETYVYLLEDMPRIIDQIAQFEVEKAEHNLFMTETALEQVVESCESFAGTGEDCFLISYFDTIEQKALALGMSQEECDALRERSDKAVLEGILPAYSRLAETLIDLTGECSELVGAAELGEDRKAFFDISVRQNAGTNEDIDTLIDRVQEMGESMLTEMIYAMYADPDALERYGDPVSFGGIEQDMAWLTEFASKYYPEMPEYKVEYVTIPDELAEDFSPAAYLTPAYDDYYDNTILINPTSDDTTRLFTLAHEGIPGHMYQFLYFRNNEGLSRMQQVLEPTGYAEGWTVFTEYFVAQNCDDIGSAYCSMMNAENVFGNIYLPAYVSLRVNHDGATLEEIEADLEDIGMSDYAGLFYEYAVTMPTYAMSYAIGFTCMYDLYSESTPNSPARHKAYFERILSYGPTYLDLLEEYMGK